MRPTDVCLAFWAGFILVLIIADCYYSLEAAGGVFLGFLFGVLLMTIIYHWVYEEAKA